MLNIFWFTLYQAFLSTLISIGGGWLTARLIWKYSYGKKLLLPLLSLYQVIPSTVLITILIICLGKQSFIQTLLGPFHFSLYGLQGILLCHFLLNFPFAVHQLLNGFERLPLSYQRLADSLQPSFINQIIFIEGKALFPLCKKVASIIFCM